MVRLIHAELRKLIGLPTAWAGLVLGTLTAPVVALLNAPYIRREITAGTLTDASDLVLSYLGIGLIGPLILGVIVVSSEYTSTGEDAPGARQLTATLIATPDRLRLLAAKTTALVLAVAAQGAVTSAAVLILTQVLYGAHVPPPAPARVAAAILYWVLTTLLAYAVTVITRNGIVPLTLLIVNSTVVSVSYLLTKVTDLAAYLPDIVGARMFIRGGDFPVEIRPVTAGLVMTAWVAALLTVAAVLFHRRDA
jgi:ABC-2 type transport system permease protein